MTYDTLLAEIQRAHEQDHNQANDTQFAEFCQHKSCFLMIGMAQLLAEQSPLV